MENKETIVRKWKVQTANKFDATMVAYIDARDVSKALDEKFPNDWSNDFDTPYTLTAMEWVNKSKTAVEKNYVTCRITIKSTGQYHEDVGSESATEAIKGCYSDAFKRAAVHFGIGRENYELPVVKLPTKEYNGKYYPCDKTGKFLKDKALLDACETELKKLS